MRRKDQDLTTASLSILTWKAPKTLEATLKSLIPIADAFGDRLIVCQEGDTDEVKIANLYGYRAEVTQNNLGILGGLKEAVTQAKHSSVLLLENDAHFIGDANDASTLDYIASRLHNGEISFACLMDRHNGPRPRYFKYWKDSWPPKPTVMGRVRPSIAKSVKADSIAMMKDNEADYDFAKFIAPNMWETSSKFYAWSNRAKFVSKSFFLKQLLPFAESHPTNRTVNGLMDLEHQINAPRQRHWYRNQDFPALVHQAGLFGHARHDRPDNDEKWETGIPIVGQT